MMYDLTITVSDKFIERVKSFGNTIPFGHMGTHFDVMNKEFPLEFTKREGVIFDVSDVTERDIDISDIDVSRIKPDTFIGFHTGYIDKVEYGKKEYFTDHPQLSKSLIDLLLEKKVSIIGVDFSGVRRGKEHTPMDQYCADRGVFIVENLCNLDKLIGKNNVSINTFPIKYSNMTGLPCRVTAEVV